ncbi:CinA family protein [Synergistaceae bacterium OttesenSCG-928-D05]|nr:CinA family protein [Synergistaceae bacterium OttesenSCG-928-D05]
MSIELFLLAEKVISAASKKTCRLAFAESCTGGLIASTLTSVPGASSIFMGSAVTYSNDAKRDILGVGQDVLDQFGAVSAACAEQMAFGAKRIYRSEVAVSVTGVAGPDGGTVEKPVGLVWFGYSCSEKTISFMRHFVGDREMVRAQTVREALEFLLKELS